MEKILTVFLFLAMLFACNTSRPIAENNKSENSLESIDGDAGMDNSSDVTGDYDGSGDGVFGRKIIFRDLSATKAAFNTSGIVVTKVCINKAGLVTYVALVGSETTIKDREVLRRFLKAARGYKFQPDTSAPVQQCGKLTFKIDNTANRRQR